VKGLDRIETKSIVYAGNFCCGICTCIESDINERHFADLSTDEHLERETHCFRGDD